MAGLVEIVALCELLPCEGRLNLQARVATEIRLRVL